MTTDTESWKDDVDTYVADVSQAFIDWKADLDALELELGLDDIAGAVKGITDESDNLTEALTGKDGVINALGQELTKVGEVTSAWA